MEHLSFKTLALVGVTALTLSSAALVAAAPVQAQSGGYALEDEGDDFERPRVQRRLVDDDGEDDAPRVERRITERRTVERRVVEEPIVERRIVEQRVLRPVVERRVVVRPVVVRPVVERRIVQPVIEQRVVRPVVVEQRRLVRVAAPVEDCRVFVTKRVGAFGKHVEKTRTCD